MDPMSASVTQKDTSKSSCISARFQKPRIQPSECRICGGPAKYSYFGAIVCQPCKMFFKRNGLLGANTLTCRFEGACEINVNNRHTCNACRLKKCFECGMNTTQFRASVKTKKKSSLTREVDSKALVQFKRIPTSNLLQADQSTLTAFQWTLLTNLLRSYHENNIICVGQRLVSSRQATDPSLVFPFSLVQEIVGAMYETAGSFIRSNHDLSVLESEDRSIVVRSAIDRVSSMGGILGLIQCNLFSYREFPTAIIPLYGASTVAKTIWTLKFFNPDIILMKLGLALFAVSENIVSHPAHPFVDLHDPMAVWRIQNQYVELTWKYLCYRYGDRDAAKQFLSLTCCLIAMTVLTVHLQDVQRHMADVESIVEKTEITLIMDDVDRIMEQNLL